MPTIRDVARHANVSVGTVSNVINDNGLVKDETRQRVLASIAELDFHPIAAARSLTTQRTNTIGMIRTELRPYNKHIENDPITLNLIDGIISAATEKNIGLTVWTIPVGQQEMDLYKRLVSSRQIDGVILFALRENDPRIAYLREQEFPFVIFGRLEEGEGCNWIDVDGAAGVEDAIHHLVNLGHRRIGYISPPQEQILTRLRWNGYVNGLQKANIPLDLTLVYEGDFSERSGQLGAHFFLDLPHPPSAIFCSNDRMAFGAMRAIQARGLTVGKDVSVIGFDDIPLASYSHPSLTTLRQPFHEIGGQLFSLLMSLIDRDMQSIPSGLLLKPELQIRHSTGVPR